MEILTVVAPGWHRCLFYKTKITHFTPPAPTHASPNGFIREVKLSELTVSSHLVITTQRIILIFTFPSLLWVLFRWRPLKIVTRSDQ